jgi:hypothetical protein
MSLGLPRQVDDALPISCHVAARKMVLKIHRVALQKTKLTIIWLIYWSSRAHKKRREIKFRGGGCFWSAPRGAGRK